jgi:hypothetical protein
VLACGCATRSRVCWAHCERMPLPKPLRCATRLEGGLTGRSGDQGPELAYGFATRSQEWILPTLLISLLHFASNAMRSNIASGATQARMG